MCPEIKQVSEFIVFEKCSEKFLANFIILLVLVVTMLFSNEFYENLLILLGRNMVSLNMDFLLLHDQV